MVSSFLDCLQWIEWCQIVWGGVGVDAKLQTLVYDILPSTTAVFNYAIGFWKLSANEQFFVAAQTVVSLLQTTQIKQGVSFTAANKVYTSTYKTTIVWIKMELSFTRGGCVSCLRVCLGARLLLQPCQYPNLSEGADRVGGQLHGDKECPFSGVTRSGRVWRKVPESDARSVGWCQLFVILTTNMTCPFDGKEHISNENLIICSFAVKVSEIIFVF